MSALNGGNGASAFTILDAGEREQFLLLANLLANRPSQFLFELVPFKEMLTGRLSVPDAFKVFRELLNLSADSAIEYLPVKSLYEVASSACEYLSRDWTARACLYRTAASRSRRRRPASIRVHHSIALFCLSFGRHSSRKVGVHRVSRLGAARFSRKRARAGRRAVRSRFTCPQRRHGRGVDMLLPGR